MSIKKGVAAMTLRDLMNREGPLVKKIIQDETWLCGERRGKPVSHRDSEVVEQVSQILLEHGADIRSTAEKK